MKTAYHNLMESEAGKLAFAEEYALTSITELLARLLDESGMTRKQYAEKIGVTPGRITQLFDSDANLTVSTIAKALCGFGRLLDVTSRRIDDFGVEGAQRCFDFKLQYETNAHTLSFDNAVRGYMKPTKIDPPINSLESSGVFK